MHLKYEFVISEVGGAYCAVCVGDDMDKYNGLIKMNKTSAYIFNLLFEDITFDEIVKKLSQKYDATPEVLTKETEKFLKTLESENILSNER